MHVATLFVILLAPCITVSCMFSTIFCADRFQRWRRRALLHQNYERFLDEEDETLRQIFIDGKQKRDETLSPTSANHNPDVPAMLVQQTEITPHPGESEKQTVYVV